jgi:GNAT superfamily N-acetyltransferase
MKVVHTYELSNGQKTAVMQLWNQEYPLQLKYGTIESLDVYLSSLTGADHFLYTGESGEILGWAFKFSRESVKWFAVILDSSIHKQGIGTLLLDQLKNHETELNGWVVDHNDYTRADGETYVSPLAFYLKNGFKILADQRLESPQLSAAKITWTTDPN